MVLANDSEHVERVYEGEGVVSQDVVDVDVVRVQVVRSPARRYIFSLFLFRKCVITTFIQDPHPASDRRVYFSFCGAKIRVIGSFWKI